MPWYDAANGLTRCAPRPMPAPLLALGELAVLALALSPDVDAAYRAYYTDRTTTCLDREVPGDYTLGVTVSFRPDGAGQMTKIRVCGLDGPVDDGTHSVGTSSRLRIAATSAAPLVLRLTMNRAGGGGRHDAACARRRRRRSGGRGDGGRRGPDGGIRAAARAGGRRGRDHARISRCGEADAADQRDAAAGDRGCCSLQLAER